MKRIFHIIVLAFVFYTVAKAQNTYTVLSGSPEQKIEHFGASDAWSMQLIGLWDEKEQTKIADWLFSLDNDSEGKPKGDAAQIQPGTRTQFFLNADGTYRKCLENDGKRQLPLARQLSHSLCHIAIQVDCKPL